MDSHTDFEALYVKAEKAITKYGFVVHPKTDIKNLNTGEFDGLNIWVSKNQSAEQALYVLLHLFGHSVQWNVDSELRQLGLDVSPGKTSEEMERIYHYELQASKMGFYLLDCIGCSMQQWISNWFYADWMWLKHFYQTGEKVGYLTYWVDDAELISSCQVPRCTPQLFVARNSF